MKCWIDNEAFRGMVAEANAKDPLETGGCLMGYWTIDGDLVVCYIVGAGQGARHHRHNFEPDAAFQSQQVGDIFDATEGRITYLGDWHTHPGGHPYPSSLDLETLQVIANFKEAQAPKPLMLILGGFGSYTNMNAFVLENAVPHQCETVLFDFVRQEPMGAFRHEQKECSQALP